MYPSCASVLSKQSVELDRYSDVLGFGVLHKWNDVVMSRGNIKVAVILLKNLPVPQPSESRLARITRCGILAAKRNERSPGKASHSSPCKA